ncbi:terminal ear1-like protein [Nymphaea thermarum]|nr:terminal ear1-like protein [Nymphaea thermarum]
MTKLNPHAPFFLPVHHLTPSPSPCLNLCSPPPRPPPHAICDLPLLQPQPFSFLEFPSPPRGPIQPFYSQSGAGYSVPPAPLSFCPPQHIIENLYVYLSPLCVNGIPVIHEAGCKGTDGGRLPSALSPPAPLTPTTVLVSAPADVPAVDENAVKEPTECKLGVLDEVSEEERRLPRRSLRRSAGGLARHQRRMRVVATYWRPKGDETLADEERKSVFQSLEFRDEDADSVWKTTVMIRNIPNKLSREMLVEKLDSHCLEINKRVTSVGSCTGGKEKKVEPLSEFDFVYLPMDFRNKCNLGYAFVNFTSSAATWRLYRAFHNQRWRCLGSKKTCEICYARIQGREALKSHFRNSNFTCDSSEYLPIEFSPPRDGSSAPVGSTIGRLRPVHLQG